MGSRKTIDTSCNESLACKAGAAQVLDEEIDEGAHAQRRVAVVRIDEAERTRAAAVGRQQFHEIELAGDPSEYFGHAARQASRLGITALTDLPHEVRLALEMAAHEDAERRALEGELAELEQAWRDAEEIAGIADEMLLSPEVEGRLAQLRGSRAGE
jgi:hypothetical protein